MSPPQIIILGGPNGAGKSTAAAHLLPPDLTFVNADEVAEGLPGYPSPEVDREAGRLVLAQMDDLEARRESFAIETTLAGRGLAARVARLKRSGYRFRLVFVWSPSADFCVLRVAARVRAGGHAIPEPTIRRRYAAGLANLFGLYQPLADKWAVYDGSAGILRRIADGIMDKVVRVQDFESWRLMHEGASDE